MRDETASIALGVFLGLGGINVLGLVLSALFPHAGIRRHRMDPAKTADLFAKAYGDQALRVLQGGAEPAPWGPCCGDPGNCIFSDSGCARGRKGDHRAGRRAVKAGQ